MNFIQLVAETRKISGLQGTGPSSVTTTGHEATLVSYVQNAWTDIQLERDEWKWMRDSRSFLTVLGQGVYTLTQALGITYRHRKWFKDTAYILVDGQYCKLYFQDYDSFMESYNNQTDLKKPSRFTIRPQDSALIIEKPDKVYTIMIDYQKSPQLLVENSDTPNMPSYYHSLISYAAAEKYCAALSIEGSYQQYAIQHARLMNILMRDQLPKKKLKIVGLV